MDFLGLKTLSEQKEAVKNVKLTRGIDVDLAHIPIDDELTYQLYQKGQTMNYQLEIKQIVDPEDNYRRAVGLFEIKKPVHSYILSIKG